MQFPADMNVSRFRTLFQAVLFGLGPAVAVLACGNSEAEPTDMPERAVCIDPDADSRYQGLTLGSAFDGIALATRDNDRPRGPFARLPSIGAPCSRATDRAACERKVTELLSQEGVQGWSPSVGLCAGCALARTDWGVVTSGDSVVLATAAQLRAAVAPIETRDEAAALLALTGGGGIDCDGDNVRPESDGWVFKGTWSSCSGEKGERFTKVTRTGEIVSAGERQLREADTNCIEGRRPVGLITKTSAVSWLSSPAACLAEIAHMEMAAVLAFRDLIAQLEALEAPAELVMRARRAKREEIAHAKITTKLARRFGAEPRRPALDGAERDLFARDAAFTLARENATEGCVREAYGALVAAFQAAHAADPEVRAAFTRIAREEAAHAELSFAIDAWLASRLSPAERLVIARTKDEAWSSLAVACEEKVAPEVARTCGMPTPEEAHELLEALKPAIRLAA